MSVLDWIVSIVLFVVSLGVLIIIHELGHLSMAKLFNVYCHEFSIGFGPAIIHKKPKGKETYISLRAIPFGGYVAMYGEEGQKFDENIEIPPERSLEGIKKWKKAIILVAGVFLNAVLALVLIGISDIAFPLKRATTTSIVNQDSIAYVSGIRDGDRLQLAKYDAVDEDGEAYYVNIVYYEYASGNTQKMGYLGIVDSTIEYNGIHYVLTYYPTGNKTETSFTDGMKIYPANTVEEVRADEDKVKAFAGWLEKGELEYYPDFKKDPYKPYDNSAVFSAKLSFIDANSVAKVVNIDFRTTKKPGNNDDYIFQDIGLKFALSKVWLPFGERVKNTFVDYGGAATAVFKGLGTIFTKGPQNMSGIIGVFETSASVYSQYTFATYFYFWGLISVNLAIFNLLPIPGLDGFTLLLTIIEGITRKSVPQKVKLIITIIGYVMLFAIIAMVLVFDILRIAGVM